MKKLSIEEKSLLFQDLCGRLPYGVKTSNGHGILKISPRTDVIYIIDNEHIPYLRPMSSMTEEEREEYQKFIFPCPDYNGKVTIGVYHRNLYKAQDWLNNHHFDYRNLIEKGLAIKAPEEMYNLKEK